LIPIPHSGKPPYDPVLIDHLAFSVH
jgi:hypothetical protein